MVMQCWDYKFKQEKSGNAKITTATELEIIHMTHLMPQMSLYVS